MRVDLGSHSIWYSSICSPVFLGWGYRLANNLTGRLGYAYYGDNKTPGRDLHDTKKGENSYLRNWFDYLHMGERERSLHCFYSRRSVEEICDTWVSQFLVLSL